MSSGYDDKLYVDDGRGNCYIYQVTIPPGADPDMHPENPSAPGEMAPRTFTLVAEPYYFKGDCGWSGYHHAEFYVDEDHIYYGPDFHGTGGIEQWVRNPDGTFGAYLGRLPIPVPPENGETFGYDADNNTWYTCTREREVYSIEMGVDAEWQYEFTYPTYEGDHHDGLEHVAGYLWLSDMTSDWIGQWEYTGTGPYDGWKEVWRFQYSHPNVVEGMGFGGPVLNHFWISDGWNLIYEVGGGELQVALERIPDQCVLAGEPFATFDLDDYVIGQPPPTWSWSGTVDLQLSVDAEKVVTVTYPTGWWGSETVTFTVTDNTGRIYSDDATFTVRPVPIVQDIPDQIWPFPPFDLDDYLDPDCGVSPGDVTWTASGMIFLEVEIDSETHVVTVTNPLNSSESEVITFTATALGCPSEEISASVDVLFKMLLEVAFDIKPASCPNPRITTVYLANLWDEVEGNPTAKAGPGRPDKPKAVLPTAILGTEDFDIADIDPATLMLEGVPPLRCAVSDVSTPVGEGAEECECTTEGADGYPDLTLKFDKSLIVEALGEVANGDTVVLTITGELYDGTPIEGSDCVISRGPASPPSGIAGVNGDPSQIVLGNHPNPFNPTTEISFALPLAASVRLDVYNIMGQKVTTLLDETLQAGEHSASWDGSTVASGVYFYRLDAGEFSETRKMMLLK